MKDNSKPLVSIRCLVYNHEPYLRQCLDGFVMQKTDFAFEAIVHDDASTDNSAAIIREYAEKYPDIIKPIYETENQYSKKDGSLRKIMNEAIHPDAKYVAFCEGDDYWTDPNKLQLQVEFMKRYSECTLTYHACKNILEEKDKEYYLMGETVNESYQKDKLQLQVEFMKRYSECTLTYHACKNILEEKDKEYYLMGETVNESYQKEELLEYPFQTATILIKKEVLFSDLYKRAVSTRCSSGDMVLYLTADALGKIMGINKQMSVYRRHETGISNTLWGKKNIYDVYVSWTKLSHIFGGTIKEQIEKKRLCAFIFESFIAHKDFRLFLKVMGYGLLNSPQGVISGLKRIIKYVITVTLKNKLRH